MLRDDSVPELFFPWTPELEEPIGPFNMSIRTSSEVKVYSPDTWWLDRQVPGYKFRWSDLNRSRWMELYASRPDLFHRLWLPKARVEYWESQFNRAMQMLALS